MNQNPNQHHPNRPYVRSGHPGRPIRDFTPVRKPAAPPAITPQPQPLRSTSVPPHLAPVRPIPQPQPPVSPDTVAIRLTIPNPRRIKLPPTMREYPALWWLIGLALLMAFTFGYQTGRRTPSLPSPAPAVLRVNIEASHG